MPARHERPQRAKGDGAKEAVQLRDVVVGQDGEARKGGAFRAVKGRRNSPDSAAALLALGKLLFLVFDQSIRRIGDDGMNRTGRKLGKPANRVLVNVGRAGGQVKTYLVAK